MILLYFYKRQNHIRFSSNACTFNPFMPTGAFNICCPRDCVSRHNGGTMGAPLKPLRVDSALRYIRLRAIHCSYIQ